MVAGWWLSGLVRAETGVKGSEGSHMGICSDLGEPFSFSRLNVASHYLIIKPDSDIFAFCTGQIWRKSCQYWKSLKNIFM